MDRTITTKLVTAVLAIFLLLTIAGQLFAGSEHSYKTEVALKYDSQDTIEFYGVFARNEHTVSRKINGTIQYEHEDGSKVGKNSVIANAYGSAADISLTADINKLKTRIDTLTDAQSLVGTDNSQIEAFDKLITEKHSKLITAINSGDYTAVSQLKYEMLNLQSKRDMVKGKVNDYSSVISALNSKIKTLEGRISASPVQVTADETGYFVSSIDGYESKITYDNIDSITPAEISETVKTPELTTASGDIIGKMMRPRFVSKVVKNGETVMEFPPEVMRPQIAKEKSIKELQTILEQVVSVGLGKKAGSPNFKVAGKTGTAQISKGAGGYKSGGTSYLISFAGYFPADAPRYSCIVCIQKSGLPASGGTMCGKVFHQISEGIMAQSLKVDVKDARDSASVFVPDVKTGNILAANYVLSHLGIKTNANWSGSYADGNPIWGKAERVGNHSIKLIREKQYGKSIVPDITGMGARDAIYNMESRGIKTQIIGRGKVVKQSLVPGTVIKKGAVCSIVLE